MLKKLKKLLISTYNSYIIYIQKEIKPRSLCGTSLNELNLKKGYFLTTDLGVGSGVCFFVALESKVTINLLLWYLTENLISLATKTIK